MIARLVALSLIFVPMNGASAQAPQQPTGKWVVEYAESQCFLSREYGTPDRPLTLVFKPSVRGDGLGLLILKRGKTAYISKRKAVIAIGPAGSAIETDISSYELRKSGLTRHYLWIEREQIANLKRARTLSVNAGKSLDHDFAVPELVAALNALDACKIDLLAGWGMPEDVQARLGTPAKALDDQKEWFRGDDYPFEALKQGAEGRAIARVRIDPSGAISVCDVVVSSGSKAIDDATCRVISKRGRYSPALDVNGVPMPSIDLIDTAWLID